MSNISGKVTVSRNVSGTVGQAVPIGNKQIYSDTTANWNAKPTLLSKKDCIYVYTDYAQEDGQDVPAMKVGTGNAFLIDLPFTYFGDVTEEQVQFWNNKVTAYIDHDDEELLVLSKD